MEIHFQKTGFSFPFFLSLHEIVLVVCIWLAASVQPVAHSSSSGNNTHSLCHCNISPTFIFMLHTSLCGDCEYVDRIRSDVMHSKSAHTTCEPIAEWSKRCVPYVYVWCVCVCHSGNWISIKWNGCCDTTISFCIKCADTHSNSATISFSISHSAKWLSWRGCATGNGQAGHTEW